MKKKFLHVCLSESWGGLEMAVTRWNQVLAENGHENLNICTPQSPLSKDLKRKKFQTLEWDSARYFSPDFTYKLRQTIIQKNIDAVVIQNLRELWIVSPALWGLKKPKLIAFTQMLTGVKKKDLLHKIIYSRLDYALTLTDWQQEALKPYLPIEKNKYYTVPNFVDTQHFNPQLKNPDTRYQMGFRNEDFIIGVIGRIDEQKGQKELLLAFNQIHAEFKNAKLLIVGEPTLGEPRQEAYFKMLKDYVQKNKLTNRVFFKGFQKETNKLTANFDLFVLSSHQETFGYVVVEAMASGTSVLGTNAGGVPEILGEGSRGFLCKPKDVKDMSQSIQHIISNSDDRNNRAIEALNYARSFYDRQKVYERFIQLLS